MKRATFLKLTLIILFSFVCSTGSTAPYREFSYEELLEKNSIKIESTLNSFSFEDKVREAFRKGWQENSPFQSTQPSLHGTEWHFISSKHPAAFVTDILSSGSSDLYIFIQLHESSFATNEQLKNFFKKIFLYILLKDQVLQIEKLIHLKINPAIQYESPLIQHIQSWLSWAGKLDGFKSKENENIFYYLINANLERLEEGARLWREISSYFEKGIPGLLPLPALINQLKETHLGRCPIAILDPDGIDISDPLFSKEGLGTKQNLFENPDFSEGSNECTICRLKDSKGYDFSDDDGDVVPSDTQTMNHGTLITQVMLLGHSFKQYRKHIRIIPVRTSEKGFDKDFKALSYAIAHGARVISISYSWTKEGIAALVKTSEAGVRQFRTYIAQHPDVIFVLSAGNDSKDLNTETVYPQSLAEEFENVIVVAATTIDKSNLSDYSNRGNKTVFIAAPGTFSEGQIRRKAGYEKVDDFLSGVDSVETEMRKKYPGFEYIPSDSHRGTSFSSPYVAMTIAVMRGINPRLTPKEIKNILMTTSSKVPHWSSWIKTSGEINPQAAIQEVRQRKFDDLMRSFDNYEQN